HFLLLAVSGFVTGQLKCPPLVTAAIVNSVAESDYISGLQLARFDPDLDRALPLLEKAVEADPESSLTHAALARAELSKYQTTGDPQWKEKSQLALQQAEHRNPDLAAVRVVSGFLNDDE